MNASWHDTVRKTLTAGTERVRVVADPDGLLLDEDLLQQLARCGYSVLLYDDPWVFRMRYEEDFRASWDMGQAMPRLLVRTINANLDSIPFDVFDQAEPIYLSVAELFSHLDRHLMAALDRRLYDRAFHVNHRVGPGRLNRRDTALRLLRDIYAVDPLLVTSREDVWDLIARIYRSGYPLSDSLAEVLADELSPWQEESGISIRGALTSRNVWESALHQALQDDDRMAGARYWLGLLGWDSAVADQVTRVAPRLIRRLRQFLDQEHLVGRDWLHRAEEIATLRLAHYRGLEGVDVAVLSALDDRFDRWVIQDYGLLQSLPPYPEPVMVHQVVHYMAHQPDVPKWALLVVDGMSYADWLYMKSLMDLSAYHVTERAVFAWAPTITSVSRKAIFSGRVPRQFGQSLGTTSGEEALWHQFWKQQHRDPAAVAFQKTADQMNAEKLLHLLKEESPDIIGLVANTVDVSAHSTTMGSKQLLENVRFWMAEGQWLPKMVRGLVDQGFHVMLTSDHGHVPVEGIGRPPTGDIPASKGQRVQIFSSKTLRDQVAREWGVPWPHLSGLPSHYVPLMAPPGKAYSSRSQQLLSHGGVAMEELIVPLIRISP